MKDKKEKPETVQKLTCQRCGYEWMPRSSRLPVQCPRCKSRYWAEVREGRKC